MGTSARVRLTVDERRQRLLRLGRRLFSKTRYDALSIDEVAAAAGVSKGLLYHYFRSKRDYYLETVRDGVDEIRKVTAPDPALPPLERLNACIDAYLAWVEANGALYSAVLRSGVGLDREIQAIVESYRETVAGWFLPALGITRPRPALRTALRAGVGAVEGASQEWLVRGGVDRPALRKMLAATLATLLESAGRIDPKAAIDPARVARGR
ncbi:MAG: TetR/AcrR family transcriptional regulator [Actinobacteria bacterium]|nr:TetR/AcrR family transcriptional regulator [Actinomycetota bacterium]